MHQVGTSSFRTYNVVKFFLSFSLQEYIMRYTELTNTFTNRVQTCDQFLLPPESLAIRHRSAHVLIITWTRILLTPVWRIEIRYAHHASFLTCVSSFLNYIFRNWRSWTSFKGWSSRLGVIHGCTNSSPKILCQIWYWMLRISTYCKGCLARDRLLPFSRVNVLGFI